MMRTLLVLSALILAGCVSYNTDLVNSKGQSTKCTGWAFGWATPIEMVAHHNCMKNAEAAGYHEAGAQAPKPKRGSALAADSTSAKPIVKTSATSSNGTLAVASKDEGRASTPQAQGAPQSASGLTQTTHPASPGSVASRLKELDELYKSGLITKKEYDEKRQEILSAL